MRKSVKLISTLIMIAILTITLVSPVFASNVVDGINIEQGNAGTMQSLAGKILGFIRNIALVGGVVIIAILGLKYMMGSLEEKSEYKKSMIPLIIGIIVVMSATTIAKLLFDTFTL